MNERKPSRWVTAVVLALVLLGVGSPLAQASHWPGGGRDPETAQVRRPDAATVHHHPEAGATRQPSTRVIAVVRADGLNWGDAGIGVAGGIGLALLVGGSALLLRQNRQRPRPAL